MTRQAPTLAVIVPVHNGAGHLDRCLAALTACQDPAFEIIVCDDGSTDESAAIALARGVRLVRLPENRGPSAARNAGVRETRADILLFVDADVEIHGDAPAKVLRHFEREPGLSAVFGSYDDSPAEANFCSQYKNLLHHFVHSTCGGPTSTFWTGLGAIRASALESVGGFNEGQRWVQDIELGYRLTAAGRTIRLDPEIQGKHMKHWSLASLVRTDIFFRAVPWARLALRRGALGDELNLKKSQRASAGLLAVALLSGPLAFGDPWFLLLPAAMLAAILWINRRLYRFFLVHRGLPFTIRAFLMQLLYFAYSGAAFLATAAAWALHPEGRRLQPVRPLDP